MNAMPTCLAPDPPTYTPTNLQLNPPSHAPSPPSSQCTFSPPSYPSCHPALSQACEESERYQQEAHKYHEEALDAR